MIIGRRVFWGQCSLAKDTSVIGKLEFVAHCNEGKSVLWATEGHLSKKVLEKTCWTWITGG